MTEGHFPYEIHLTVDHQNSSVDKFFTVCRDNDIKAILLDLDGETQVTTSYSVYGNYQKALSKTKFHVMLFERQGITVTRIKIETVPSNTKAKNETGYYETHFTFLSAPEEREYISIYCRSIGIHMSKNALKFDENDLTKFMGTIRSRESEFYHNKLISESIQKLNLCNINPFKIINEYVIYDSNEGLDNRWMNKPK